MALSNTIKNEGDKNIIIQNVSGSTITLKVDGQIEEITARLDLLIALMQKYESLSLQVGETIYNIGQINEATFGEILKKAPKVLTMPPFDFPYFIGREEELKTVHDRLFAGENFLMLVNGQGGIGKTAFASEYWKRYKHEYTHLAFLFVENGIANALLSLARALDLQFTTESTEQQLAILIQTVNKLDRPCLLILDNANDEKDLNDNIVGLRKCSNFHILLTSRLSEAPYTEKYPIGTLSKPLALELFKKHYPLLDASEIPLLEEIYDAVGGNTLVLELLAKNLTNLNKLKKRYTLPQLKTDLQNNLLQLSHSKAIHTEYQAKGTGLRHETPEAIILAMYDLTDLTDTEQALLSVFAVLPAENIEFETLTTLLQDDNLDTPLLTLAQKGWIEQSNTAFKISPVVQDITKYKNKQRLEADCETLIATLINELLRKKIFRSGLDDVNGEKYLSYSENIIKFMNSLSDNMIKLSRRVGNYYYLSGNLYKALEYYEKCNEIYNYHYKNYLSLDSKYALGLLHQKLGNVLKKLGNKDKALEHFLFRRDLMEELCNLDPFNLKFKQGLSLSYEKIGGIFSIKGLLEDTYDLYLKRNKIMKELIIADPNNNKIKHGLAISHEKIGTVLKKMGKLDEALLNFLERIKLMKQLTISEPKNVVYKHGLAISYEKIGEIHLLEKKLPKALSYLEKRNQLMREIHLIEPKNTLIAHGLAISYQQIGEVFVKQNKIKEARNEYSKQNKIMEQLCKDSKHDVLFMNGLALSYGKIGHIDLKIKEYERALSFFIKKQLLMEKLFSFDSDRMIFKNNLAKSYDEIGETYLYLSDFKKSLFFLEKGNILFTELSNTAAQNVQIQNHLAYSNLLLGKWYEKNNLREQSEMFFMKAKTIWHTLTEQVPQVDEYKENFKIVENHLKTLE